MFYFFKKIKKLLQFTLEKITCCAKREEKSRGKIPTLDIKWSVPKVKTDYCKLNILEASLNITLKDTVFARPVNG